MNLGIFSLGLIPLMLMVLVLPFSVRYVEEELEIFLFGMGLLAVSLSRLWSLSLVTETLAQPLGITFSVGAVGLVFFLMRSKWSLWIRSFKETFGLKCTLFSLVFFLGLLSAWFTAVVAALILVEAVSVLRLKRASEIRVVILACYAIGLGSALTPVGGPLAAITISRLNANFYFLAGFLGIWILPLMLLLGLLAAFSGFEEDSLNREAPEGNHEGIRSVLFRTIKIYFFVAGLVLLGAGFAPLAHEFLLKVPAWMFFWINLASAFLDNATLAAIEVSPALGPQALKAALLGLVISGGMLIPGNIPNIICAQKLKIGSRDWAIYGVPLGLLMMFGIFAVLFFAR